MEIGMAHGAHMDAQNFVAAQAIKDATMAYFILKNRGPKELFIHYNGDYHSKDRGGICWYLKQYDPEIMVRTISSVSRDTPGFDDECKGLRLILSLSFQQPWRDALPDQRRETESRGAVSLAVR